MTTTRTVFRITAFLLRSISKDVLEALKAAGVNDLYMTAARSLVIDAKKGLFSLLPGRDLISDSFDMIFFLVGKETESPLFNLVVETGHLSIPGTGSVVSEEIEVPAEEILYNEKGVQPFDAAPLSVHPHAVTGICCIVQRGRGDGVARIALDTGTCVPTINFGIGTGVRDKMGLLRITIPAEKEIIHVFSAVHEADGLLRTMVEVGDLEQPGKGFIHTYPVGKAVVNMRVIRGGQQHAATIEQVIAAIDHMKGGTEWRRRAREMVKLQGGRQKIITERIDMNLLCDGGTGSDLVKAAMKAGAGGATIADFRHVRPPDSPLSTISPLRELCSMVVPKDRLKTIVGALKEAGAFTDRCHGQIHFRRVPKAVTYMGR
ncbi:MAG: hypothetical protein QG552_2695 [Thermodesulfobacteriota bacterium]|nr:hypothetical protein [Thermodesulfobacteriota bacterium]